MVSKHALSPFNLLFNGRDRLMQTMTKKNTVRISCCSSHSHVSVDPYKVLGIRPWDSVPQVKKAFRKLAKQYHPDVCKGKDCEVQFKEINAAYEAVMSELRGESRAYGKCDYYDEANNNNNDNKNNNNNDNNNDDDEEEEEEATEQDWDYGEEWLGWEVGNWMFYQYQQEGHNVQDNLSSG